MSEIWIIIISISLQAVTLLYILYHLKNQDKLSVKEWREVVNNTREDLEPLIQQDLQESVNEALAPVLASIDEFEKISNEINILITSFNEHEKSLEQVMSRISSMESNIQSINANQITNEQEISQILSVISQIKHSINENISNHQNQLSVINKKLDTLDAELTAYSIETPAYGGRR